MKSVKILLIDLGDARGELNEPLGIECIATSLRTTENNIVDIQWYNMDHNLEDIKLDNYNILGVSMNIGVLSRFDELLYHLERRQLTIPIIVGGTIPTFGYFDLLKKYPNIICIRGEGEDAFLELTELYHEYKRFEVDELIKIGNLAFISNNQLIETDLKPVKIQILPTVYRDLKVMTFLNENKGIARIEGSRGCSWNKCTFCCIKAKYADANWNPFPIEKIVRELIELSNLGFKSPYFTDEDFFGRDYERAINLAKMIKFNKEVGKIHRDMNFFISILASDLANEQGRLAIVALKEAGLREVFMGIESMCAEQIRRYKKKASIDVNQKAIDFIHSVGLQLDTGYILFDPKMNFEELEENINYIEEIKLNMFDARSLKRLRLQPLTEITNDLISLRDEEMDLDNLEYRYRFIDSRVQKIYSDYSDWEDVLKFEVWHLQSISRGESDENLRVKLKEMLGEVREVDFYVLKQIIASAKDEIGEDELQVTLKEGLDNKRNIISKFQLT